jgi:hypothetical protein
MTQVPDKQKGVTSESWQIRWQIPPLILQETLDFAYQPLGVDIDALAVKLTQFSISFGLLQDETRASIFIYGQFSPTHHTSLNPPSSPNGTQILHRRRSSTYP